MPDSTMVITGATGFIGRHLLEALHHEYDIWTLSRGSPSLRGVSLPASVRWLPVDVARAEQVGEAAAAIRRVRRPEILIHLAGHYDFTGQRDPEYLRTNVEGTRNVLEAARELGVRDVVFASSVAACGFPAVGEAVTELSPPDGDTPYAESKRLGEAMVADFRGAFRAWTVRFAAVFSDWCEYEPLFRFMETWLSRRPQHRMVAGNGLSAVPYLHVRDAVEFVRRLLARRMELDDREILVASGDGATSHLELFQAVTGAHHGERAHPVFVPQFLCRSGLWLRDLVGRAMGMHAFERPWMGRMIDLRLEVNAARTRERLGWAPRPRLDVVRRMPFLVDNRKSFGPEWHRRNRAASRGVRLHDNLRVVSLLEKRLDILADSIVDHVRAPGRAARFPHFQALDRARQRADAAVLLGGLADAVRTGEKALFRARCHDLARRRRAEGFTREEIIGALEALGDSCVISLGGHDPTSAWGLALYDHLAMTVQYGIDEVLEVFEEQAEG
jgi:nucleoside-diphosphate-sugar epimerase